MSVSIPETEWIWQGHAGHLIVAEWCRFHMATRVGDVLVSTVGDYFPPGKEERETIDCGRFFETFVFAAGATLDCGCTNAASWSEIDCAPANSAAAATANHMEMCRKWARQQAELRLVSEVMG